MSSVFYRAVAPLVAAQAVGSWVTDEGGQRYLDAAGGAILCGVGHGRREVIDAIAKQLRKVDYVHASTFTTEITEEYCAAVAQHMPMTGARIYPVAGGSEATETALKMTRAYQLALGRPDRIVVLAREGSYHGNTLGALDLSGRPALRAPYEPWLGRFRRLPLAFAPELVEEAIVARDDVAAFIAEPISGAARAALVPPAGYWPAVAEICRRHDVLLIADEVMTGFGRTGRWFGVEHWQVEPDLLVAGKGASSGYWPLGLAVASGRVHDTIGGTLVHGFTYSHHPAGAAAGLAVLRIIEQEGLVERSAHMGETLMKSLRVGLADQPIVGEIRGRGLLIGVEIVADRDTNTPFPPEAAMTDRLLAAAREAGLLLYPASRAVDGTRGDAVLLGPPLTLTDADADELVERLTSTFRLFIT